MSLENQRIYVDEGLRINPNRFLILLDHLAAPTIVIPNKEFIPIHTFSTIILLNYFFIEPAPARLWRDRLLDKKHLIYLR